MHYVIQLTDCEPDWTGQVTPYVDARNFETLMEAECAYQTEWAKGSWATIYRVTRHRLDINYEYINHYSPWR